MTIAYRTASEKVVPLVHYIWWGNPPTDRLALDACKTLNHLASLGRGCVHYWRNSADTMLGRSRPTGANTRSGRSARGPSARR